MRQATGRTPNRLGLGINVFNALKVHPAILERVKFGGTTANPANVTENVLAQLFGVDRIVIDQTVQNKAGLGQAANMQFIGDPNSFLLAYATDTPSIEEPSAGYIFTWDMLEKVDGCVKRVACDERTKEYIQLQAVKLDDDTYMVQEFDNELVFMGELWSGCKYPDEVLDWMKSNYEIESCLTAEVYRSSLGDCTNNGISSYARELYILDAQKGPFEPDDIRQCVYIEKREIMGQEYVDCKPAYCRKRWYMAGGNILYTSDSRFKQITGISYPIAIHDRYEGR